MTLSFVALIFLIAGAVLLVTAPALGRAIAGMVRTDQPGRMAAVPSAWVLPAERPTARQGSPGNRCAAPEAANTGGAIELTRAA